MSRRLLLMLVLAVACTAAAVGPDQWDGSVPVDAAGQAAPVWDRATIWAPSLGEVGVALAGPVNQADAACTLDVSRVVATNGDIPDATVYAFVVTWGCPPDLTVSGATWNSAMLWRATLAEMGDALAELVSQTDASCIVDVYRAVSTNGAGPEGSVCAFAITWACPGLAPPAATAMVDAGNFFFAPEQLTVPVNTGVPVAATNILDIPHTFTVEALGISVEIAPGTTETVTVTATPATTPTRASLIPIA